ncbi:DNA-binding protein [Arsenicitalea aurantiaca]|uniref:DNA-binding protein n=1 Tax=Arsenicitalea aurantiaca TaxID=1783274 RepID=A0A433X345_9HYPH|nr:DNA-binding protein [Arsenicitalea aurantiaca]RUT28500.1 DNA-binding protein [Arsenicitalea aurantiaca]
MNGHDLFIDQIQLARRWKLSHRTLERWRWLSQGPSYTKIGRRVVYRLVDVEQFEAEGLHATTIRSEAERRA